MKYSWPPWPATVEPIAAAIANHNGNSQTNRSRTGMGNLTISVMAGVQVVESLPKT